MIDLEKSFLRAGCIVELTHACLGRTHPLSLSHTHNHTATHTDDGRTDGSIANARTFASVCFLSLIPNLSRTSLLTYQLA